jgi:alkaline phosphatase D
MALPGLAIGCVGEDDPSKAEAFDAESVPESTARFPRTPIAGDMTADRVVLTFHVADDSAVTLRVWTGDVIVVDEAFEANGDGFHKAMIDDLDPDTAYEYAIFGGKSPDFEDRSLLCTFRTAPQDDTATTVRFALLCCVGQGTVLPDYFLPDTMTIPTPEPFQWEIFKQAADRDVDFFIHLGDQGYLDFVWSEQQGTVDAYLHAWGFYHGGGYRDVYPLAGVYMTWDDHEAADNAKFDPWDMSSDDRTKVANAHEAWYRAMPIDAYDPADQTVWRSFRWGRTLELVLLDCRYELGADQLMSDAQLDWLLERIETSPCDFICVATPKPFADITTSQELLADNADRWDGYPAQRARLEAVMEANDARHVVFVCGDIHMNYLGRGRITGDNAPDQAWEVCCTSGNYSPLATGLSDEQFVFVDPNPHFPVLTFDPDAGTVHVEFYAVDGSLAYERTLEGVVPQGA